MPVTVKGKASETTIAITELNREVLEKRIEETKEAFEEKPKEGPPPPPPATDVAPEGVGVGEDLSRTFDENPSRLD